jgi:hypothetical protein
MTITNTQLIRDALGILGVLAETESASPEQLQLGLRVLNEIMAAWERKGVDLEYHAQTISDAGQQTPVPDVAIGAVKYSLAFALATYFPANPMSAAAVLTMDELRGIVERDAVLDSMKPSSLTHMPLGRDFLS